jgi:hypothetical protein
MRLEEKTKDYWIADWAFAIKEESASREGYQNTTVCGAFAFAAEYPGCPHCGARSIFKCGCGRVACWDGETRRVTCPWCEATAELVDDIKSLRLDGDR